jgi:hypothetical protein
MNGSYITILQLYFKFEIDPGTMLTAKDGGQMIQRNFSRNMPYSII